MIEGITDRHVPVLWILPSRQASGLDAAVRASPRSASAASACCRWISYLPYLSRGHGLPTWTRPSCGALQRGVLLWHIMLSSLLPRSELDRREQSQHGWPADRWFRSRGSGTWPPERGPGGICPTAHPIPPETHTYARSDALHKGPLLLEGLQ